MNGYSDSQFNSDSSGSIRTILFAFILVHGLLLAFGLGSDTSIMSGDRSTSRDATIAYVFNLEKIGSNQSLIESGHDFDSEPLISDRIRSSGHAGDYLIQGIILKLTNPKMLVVFQLALALLATFCVFGLLQRFGFSSKSASWATVFYLCLPGSLLPAHQLSSEALFIPCVIVSCYLLVNSSERKGIDASFVAGLLVLSLAIFVRPQLIFFPFLLLFIYILFSAKKFKTVLVTVIPLGLLFSIIWMAFITSENGRFSFGGEDRSIGMTFHQTAEQMAMPGRGQVEFDLNTYQTRTMRLNDFIKLVADNPYSYFRQRAISMVNFVVNPGAYSLAVRHLKLITKNNDKYYWQHLRARVGLYDSVVEIVKRGPLFSLLIFSTTLMWCLVIFSAITGLVPLIKDKKVGSFAKSLLLGLVAYQVGIVMLFSVGARWQQRSLVDFVVVLLALYGLKVMHTYFSLKRQAPKIESVGGIEQQHYKT